MGSCPAGTYSRALYSKKNHEKLRATLNTEDRAASIFIYEKTIITLNGVTRSGNCLARRSAGQYWNPLSSARGRGACTAGIRSDAGPDIRSGAAVLRAPSCSGTASRGRGTSSGALRLPGLLAWWLLPWLSRLSRSRPSLVIKRFEILGTTRQRKRCLVFTHTAASLATGCRFCQEETAPGWMVGIDLKSIQGIGLLFVF